MTTIFDHLAYVRVSWSYGQTFLTMAMPKFQNDRGQMVEIGRHWLFLTMTIAKF